MQYQAYYFEEPTMRTNPIEKYFKTRKQAMKYYNENKHIGYGWFVAKVDEDGFIIEDIIY